MDKVIVYGLGKKFNFNKEKIVKLYDRAVKREVIFVVLFFLWV